MISGLSQENLFVWREGLGSAISMLEAFADGAQRRNSVLKTDRHIKALELATLELATFESTT